jgi:geranylgeranyl pyrophosphate synthase
MRYSVLSGGKRIRPMLTYASCAALGSALEYADASAASVEIIHAYSLIHDDLPAMDDDPLRRGQPTCHIVFGEAMAILAGDALQALAFEVLTTDLLKRHIPLNHGYLALQTLAQACGPHGMAGGQALDLAHVGKSMDAAALQHMHAMKTGALIRASVLLGAHAALCIDDRLLDHLDRYAQIVGLAFQIRDDIIDIEGSTEIIGKQQGADIARNKPTYPSVLGLEQARHKAQLLREEALSILERIGLKDSALAHIACYAVDRES